MWEDICTTERRGDIDPEILDALTLDGVGRDGAKLRYVNDGDCYLIIVRVPDYSD